MIKLNRQVENLEDIINKIEMKIEELEEKKQAIMQYVVLNKEDLQNSYKKYA